MSRPISPSASATSSIAASPGSSRSASSPPSKGLGGDGLVPVSTLGADYFRYDEKSQTLVGDDTQVVFAPGQRLKLKLAEANPVSGGLRFELPETPGDAGRSRFRRDGSKSSRDDKRVRTPGKRGRPANIRHKGGKRS